MSIRVEGCKCVGRNGSEFYFVSSIFEHGDGLKGCTGFIVRPVSPEEYDWASDRENIAERLEDVYECCYTREGRWYRSDNANGERRKGSDGRFVSRRESDFEDFVDDAILSDGVDHIMFDTSYGCESWRFFEAIDEKFESTDCIGCGRIFDKDSDYEELFDHAAWMGVRAWEGGSCSFEWAARTIFGDDAYYKGLKDSVERIERRVRALEARLNDCEG
jgi:hypothetical protein